MTVRELGAVVGLAPLAEERPGTCLVELRVVEHQEAWIPQRVGPHVVVTGGIADVVDAFARGAFERFRGRVQIARSIIDNHNALHLALRLKP